ECAAEAFERVALVDVVEVALAFPCGARHVEARLGAGAREGDVAPLLEPRLARAEDEGTFYGEPLGGVTGAGIGVPEVARLEVGAAQLGCRGAVGRDGERARVAVDSFDGPGGAVGDAEAVRVAHADDAVAGGELVVGEADAIRAEASVGVHQL